MVAVNLWSGLRALADGQEVVEVEGDTVGQILDALVAAYPGLEPAIARGVSVSVDGQIIANNRHVKVAPDAEVFLLQRLYAG